MLLEILLCTVIVAIVCLTLLSMVATVPWWLWVGIIGFGLWVVSKALTPNPLRIPEETTED